MEQTLHTSSEKDTNYAEMKKNSKFLTVRLDIKHLLHTSQEQQIPSFGFTLQISDGKLTLDR
jgi:hypothetical protein